MTENKKLKRKLIVQSFLPLSILIVIKSVTKETLGKIYCLLDSMQDKSPSCDLLQLKMIVLLIVDSLVQ